LENTCDEIARNGFNKIVIVNGHGGNPELIKYFIQTRLEKERNYAVYFFQPSSDSAFSKQLAALRHSDAQGDQHAGERETSEVLYFRPELVQLDSAKNNPGKIKTGYPYQMCTLASGGTPIFQTTMLVKATKPQ